MARIRYDADREWRCLITSSYLRKKNEGVSHVCACGGRDARKHCHGAIRHGAKEINRQALVETGPALLRDELLRGAHDPCARVALDHPVRRRVVRERPALRLQARADHLVRVRRDGRRHLRHRRAQQDGLACDGRLGVAL